MGGTMTTGLSNSGYKSDVDSKNGIYTYEKSK
jgi:hypothetical protein